MNSREEDELNILFDSFLAALEKRDVQAATSNAIVASEAKGQKDFVASETLPQEMRHVTREDLEKLGFVFGAPVAEIFVECTLPPGWSKVPTDHNMWSELRDDTGTKRAMIFYKAAYYDRSATLHWERA